MTEKGEKTEEVRRSNLKKKSENETGEPLYAVIEYKNNNQSGQ